MYGSEAAAPAVRELGRDASAAETLQARQNFNMCHCCPRVHNTEPQYCFTFVLCRRDERITLFKLLIAPLLVIICVPPDPLNTQIDKL